MRRKTNFYVDHFGFLSKDFVQMLDLFDDLGFHMGDYDKSKYAGGNASGHYYMNHGSAYLEMGALDAEGNCAWPKKRIEEFYGGVPINPKGIPGVYNVILNTRDIEEVGRRLKDKGIKPSPKHAKSFMVREARGDIYYASIGGSPLCSAITFNIGIEPFPNMLYGVMQHYDNDQHWFSRPTVREYHPNGVTGISSCTLYYETPEELMTALKLIDDVQYDIRDLLDPNHTSNAVLVDKEAYEKEFGVPAPVSQSNVAAMEFAGGDLDYITQCAEKLQLSHFVRDGKLYIDAREVAGAFLIFA